MFHGVPRQPDFPPPYWERGFMFIADRDSREAAGLLRDHCWTPRFWTRRLWLRQTVVATVVVLDPTVPYKGRKAETRAERLQRLCGKRLPRPSDAFSSMTSDSPSDTSSTTSSSSETPSDNTDKKELITDLSAVAAATAAAGAEDHDDSGDTQDIRALLRPKKKAKGI